MRDDGHAVTAQLARPQRPTIPATTIVHGDLALVVLAIVIAVRADDDVAVSVAIDVPRRADRKAELGCRLTALDAPVPDQRRPPHRTPVEIDPPLVAIITASAGQDVRKTIPVHIPRRAHRDAEGSAGVMPLADPRHVGRQPRCAAVVDEYPPLVRVPVVIARRTDDEVGIPIPVHIPSRPRRLAESGPRLNARDGPGGGDDRPLRCAVVDQHPSLVRPGPVIVGHTDDDVRVAVPIHIPRRPHRIAEPPVLLVPLGDPVRDGGQPARRATVDISPPLVRLVAVIVLRPDDEVGIPIPVHIPSRPHRGTEPGLLLIALRHPGGSTCQPRRRAVVDKGRSLVHLTVAVVACTDDYLRVTVVVHIPRRPHRPAELDCTVVSIGGPVRRHRGTGRRAVVDKGSPPIRIAVIIARRTDDDVGIAVTVHVPRRPHRVAEPRPALLALRRPAGGRGRPFR